jgi:hypothetical protein
MSGSLGIEARSLLWSRDSRWLAAQELVSWQNDPRTRVVVFDTKRRERDAASPPRVGIGSPLRFERGRLVYRHWNHHVGEQEMSLDLSGE